MREMRFVFSLSILAVWILAPAVSAAIDGQMAKAFVGQDLHLAASELTSYQLSSGKHLLVLQGSFSMSIAANQFFSDGAVVWLDSIKSESRGKTSIDVNVRVYMEGNVQVKRSEGAKTTDLQEVVLEKGGSMDVQFDVSGEVFVTADKRVIADPRELELYKTASAVQIPAGPRFIVQPGAIVPEFKDEPQRTEQSKAAAAEEGEPSASAGSAPSESVEGGEAAAAEGSGKKKITVAVGKKPGLLEGIFGGDKSTLPTQTAEGGAVKAEEKKPRFSYPVNIAPAGETEPKIESAKTSDNLDIATVIGRFYLWQKQDEEGNLLELQADNAVIFYSGKELSIGKEKTADENVLAKGSVKAIYMSGDVVMTEGQRTIRSDEVYYDFQDKKALVINAVMRSFDSLRGIPIYVRAAKLRQLAQNQFSAQNVTLTSSEFYLPQLSFNASSVIITDTTAVDEQMQKISKGSYDAQMKDVRLKYGKNTIFYWPFIRSNLERPDVPLKSIRVGRDSTFGASLETRWFLSRLLGLKEPEGVDSTLALDYFSKRGVGAGAEIDYTADNYFGKLLGYVINDSGEDDLGRLSSRRDIKHDNDIRGRFHWEHRQFLPNKWQLTTGVGYASDETFIEAFYRNEYQVGTEETYVHLKRIEDNRAISFLGKGRINDFADELEEMPTAEFHWTGQSLFDDKFTLYSDSQASRFRQRVGDEHEWEIDRDHFSFLSHRTELDMPLRSGPFKIVPFTAGTFGYDDRSGFTRTLVDGSHTGRFGEDQVLIGEAGVRVFPNPLWRVYDVKSRLWDLNKLRHIIEPQLTAVLYEESDDVVEQKDTLLIGMAQRLQTKRGTADNQRTVDWMRLDTDFVWVSDPEPVSSTTSPSRMLWNKPIVPLRVLSAPNVFHGDLEPVLNRFEIFGPTRNYFSADYVWRITDSSVVLSDMNFDMQSGVAQQFDIGFSHLCWPNLSYYIGSRYLRRVEVLDEKGSNAVTFAATYVIDPRYTLVFAQQFDFDYGANIRSDITLIRRYHRMYCSFTYSADESLKRSGIMFSMWPQGVSEIGIGRRSYAGVNDPEAGRW